MSPGTTGRIISTGSAVPPSDKNETISKDGGDEGTLEEGEKSVSVSK